MAQNTQDRQARIVALSIVLGQIDNMDFDHVFGNDPEDAEADPKAVRVEIAKIKGRLRAELDRKRAAAGTHDDEWEPL